MNDAVTPSPLSGLLILDKPTGYTSMDICAIVRRKLRKGGAPKRVKVGHGGTLDPLATGVLVVLCGKATPLCNVIMAGEKEYVTDVDLSRASTTDDAEGQITEIPSPTPPTRERIDALIPRFVGEIQQTPPDYSAIHVGGRRAYQIAREGGTPVLAARAVTVVSIKVIDYAWPILRLDITCGKGVYIRSLARDIGRELGVGGMLTALRRTRVGEFTIERAVALASLPEVMGQGDLLHIPRPEDPQEPAQRAQGR